LKSILVNKTLINAQAVVHSGNISISIVYIPLCKYKIYVNII